MANTTNFGWETPDDTDLVKDGAAAMRTLGNAIDTSLVDLKGGTTGQVLSKTSNTDMDFTWVTSDDANAIQNAIVDAKGDLISATAADTPARLAVGNNGETLVADSSATTGLRWAGSYEAGKNAIINGDFNIWQRGTSFTNPNFAYTADRWAVLTSGTASRNTDAPTGFRYSLAMSHTSASYNLALQRIESGKTVLMTPTITLSFWAKKTSGTDDLQVSLYYANSADNFGSVTFISQTNLTNGSFSTSWTRYTLTTTFSSTALANGIEIRIFTADGSANGWRLAGVQFENGSVATAFQTATGTLAGELAACQRYYVRTSGNTYTRHGQALASSTTNATVLAPIPVTMRTDPSVSYSNTAYWDGTNFRANTGSASAIQGTNRLVYFDLSVASGLTAGSSYQMLNNNNSAGFLEFSAEL